MQSYYTSDAEIDAMIKARQRMHDREVRNTALEEAAELAEQYVPDPDQRPFDTLPAAIRRLKTES